MICVMKKQRPSPTDRAIAAAGGPIKMAQALDVTVGAVYQWRKHQRVPYNKCLSIEELYGVSRYELRPDVFGIKPRS